ncbi:MAG: hypothetical protein ACRYGK_18300 [Janthinobacterium lividum]
MSTLKQHSASRPDVDVLPCFIDLPAQGLALFGRKPGYRALFMNLVVTTLDVGTLAGTLVLALLVATPVPLLRMDQPAARSTKAGEEQARYTDSFEQRVHHHFSFGRLERIIDCRQVKVYAALDKSLNGFA